jgi:exo-beta-1,3-glucanase (GH17 family)
MQTEKLVFNKLFGKTELASEKVELGVIDDIVKEKEKYSKSVQAGNSKSNSVVDNAKAAISLYQQAIKDYGVILNQVNAVKKQAAQLGFDIPPKINQLEQEVNSSLSYMDKRIKGLTSATTVTS